jgi:hypothetical protein
MSSAPSTPRWSTSSVRLNPPSRGRHDTIPQRRATLRPVNVLEAAGLSDEAGPADVECTGCGKRSRVEARVPDVRTRVSAIELLLREGLDRPATAKEVPSPR